MVRVRSMVLVLALVLLAFGGFATVRELTKAAPLKPVPTITVNPHARDASAPDGDSRRTQREARERRAERARARERARERERKRERARKRREERARRGGFDPPPANLPDPQPAPAPVAPPPATGGGGDEDGGDD
jgi:hypothetical protein